jgi:hypothetical protein
MKWVELIKLRSAAGSKKTTNELSELVNNVLKIDDGVEIHLYAHPFVIGDLFIQISWESSRASTRGSQVGLGVAQAFKKFGLVDHSCWIKVEKGDEFPLNIPAQRSWE